MRLRKDFREFIESLNSHHVDFVIVGAYALAFHGSPRYTGDLDILVRPNLENAARIEQAIRDLGFASTDLKAADFAVPDQIVQLGHPPLRIDLITSLTGVTFDEVWQERVPAELDGVPVSFIGRDAFIKNKKAIGRMKDKADLESLGAE